MKRKSLFLISTLIFLNNFSGVYSPASAIIDYEGVRYYDITDLLEIEQEAEAIKITECGENYDYECGGDAIYDAMQTDKRYVPYESFRYNSFLISAINPEENTARLIYRNEDRMFKELTGITEYNEMEELYLYWLDPEVDSLDDSVLNRRILSVIRMGFEDSKIHILFAGNKPEDFDWIIPNIEVTIPIGGDVSMNTTQYVHFYASESNGGASIGVFDTISCLNSPDYEPGMECLSVYGEDWSTQIIPTWPRQSEDININDDLENEPGEESESGSEDELSAESDLIDPIERGDYDDADDQHLSGEAEVTEEQADGDLGSEATAGSEAEPISNQELNLELETKDETEPSLETKDVIELNENSQVTSEIDNNDENLQMEKTDESVDSAIMEEQPERLLEGTISIKAPDTAVGDGLTSKDDEGSKTAKSMRPATISKEDNFPRWMFVAIFCGFSAFVLAWQFVSKCKKSQKKS